MKKILFLFLFGIGLLNAQTGYKGSSNGSPITIDISDSRYAFAEGSKCVVVFQTKNVTLDSTLSSFIGDACDAYISMTSKKKQGVLKAGQVFSVNRAFVDKVLPITGGCVVLTKDPSISFEVSTSYATVSAAMIQCASGMSEESTDAENGLYLDGTTVKMGGDLTENTVVYGDNYYMILDSLTGFSAKAVSGDAAEAYLTLSTNLAQPSTLSHYETVTGNYAAVSMDGDGVSSFKSADDNDLDYAEVTVSYEDLKASMKAVVNDGAGYSEVSVANNVIVHAESDISIDASGAMNIYAGGVTIRPLTATDTPALSLVNESNDITAHFTVPTIGGLFITPTALTDVDLYGRKNYMIGQIGGWNVGTEVIAHNVVIGDNNNIASLVTEIGGNVIIGTNNVINAESAIGNVLIGVEIAPNSVYLENNIAIGVGAMGAAGNSINNIAIGSGALQNTANAELNVAVGINAFSDNTAGVGNSGVGLNVFTRCSNCSYNTGIGHEVGMRIESGDYNTFIGAGIDNPSFIHGAYNTFLGALIDVTADDIDSSTVIGVGSTVSTSNVIVMATNNVDNPQRVGIGTSAPVQSAKLEVSSTTKGFLPPRMGATQASAISSPAEGLLIYVLDTNGTFTTKGWWGYNGSAWEKLDNL